MKAYEQPTTTDDYRCQGPSQPVPLLAASDSGPYFSKGVKSLWVGAGHPGVAEFQKYEEHDDEMVTIFPNFS